MDDDRLAVMAQLSAQVRQSARRLARLENDATEAEVLFNDSAGRQSSFNERFSSEVAVLARSVGDAHRSVESLTRDLGRVSLRFRELVKRDVLEEVERKAAAWPLEYYITREEFSRLLRRSFTP
ncbi:hypothetical protein JXA12_03580 [Candidatus Woesearchaeota archaeon]|nr:hypothetical protein [Candidatus Woesearchaeota archaeon]